MSADRFVVDKLAKSLKTVSSAETESALRLKRPNPIHTGAPGGTAGVTFRLHGAGENLWWVRHFAGAS